MQKQRHNQMSKTNLTKKSDFISTLASKDGFSDLPISKRNSSDIQVPKITPMIKQADEITYNEIVVFNTDDKISPQPEESLEVTRQQRVQAMLGKQFDLVSIVVQAYNRLAKTKTCVECILKYTTTINYELILLDNGSTDGTLEFFKNVPYDRKKIYHVTKNLGSLAPGPQIEWNGRYLAYVIGDAYVTQNWLTNLLTCLSSDATIGVAVPVIFNEDHNEEPKFTFNSFAEMQEKAAKHNISDPRLWHERILIEPVAGVYKREALDIAGNIADYGFYHSSSDYDLAFRIRRAGYKAVLCKDTYVHHDHPRTEHETSVVDARERDLRAAGRDFQRKYYGLNGWDDAGNYEMEMLSLVDLPEPGVNNQIDILGVEVRCGTPILELKNRLREGNSFNSRLSAFSTDPKYWLDLKTICSGEVIVDRIEYFDTHFSTILFDYILVEKPINTYQQPLVFLQQLLKRLKKDGHLLIKLRNTYDVITVLNSLGANIQVEDTTEPTALPLPVHIDILELQNHLKSSGYIFRKIAVKNWPLDENFQKVIKKLLISANYTEKMDETLTRIFVRDYVFDIVNNPIES
jgi:O-antigen biosynthesis protein